MESEKDDHADLKALLKQKSEDVEKAAKIGKALLEQNCSLEDRIDGLMKQHAAETEKWEQEKYELQLKLDQMVDTEKWYLEEISQHKQILQQEKDLLEENLVAEWKEKVSVLQRRIADLQADLEESQNKERQTRESVSDLTDLLNAKLNQTVVGSKSFASGDGDETVFTQEELEELQNEVTGLKTQLIEMKEELQIARHQITKLNERLSAEQEDNEEMRCQLSSCSKTLENARIENLDMKAQMDVLQMEAQRIDNKGNSLFSEVEDRRVMAEKKLLSMKVQLETMNKKYELEKQQHHKLKTQMLVLMQMNAGQPNSEYVTGLQQQLTEAQTELRMLNQEVHQLQAKLNEQEKLAPEAAEKQQGDDYVQYLRGIIEGKRKEIKELSDDLQCQSMELLDERSNVTKMNRKLHEAQCDNDKLRNQCTKLSLRIEELRTKYEPETLKKAPKVIRSEKIPMPEDNVENTLKETSIIHETSMVSRRKHTQDTTIHESEKSVSKEALPASEQPVLAEIKKNKKAVSISDDVSVVVSEESDSSEVFESVLPNVPKGRRVHNIKRVAAPKQNVNDCKSQ